MAVLPKGRSYMKRIFSVRTMTGLVILLLIQGTISRGAETKMESGNSTGSSEAVATFAGGCFWCIEADFEKMPGVLEAVSGYTGGHVENPSYEEVCSGATGHTEAVLVRYDPSLTTYAELLKFFWRHIDPVDAGGQFVDRGSQYRSAIFYHDEEQKRLAELSKEALERSGVFDRSIATEISKATRFYSAEDYHQGYSRHAPSNTGRTGPDRAGTDFSRAYGTPGRLSGSRRSSTGPSSPFIRSRTIRPSRSGSPRSSTG